MISCLARSASIPRQFHKVIHRQIGQVLLGGHAFRGQHACRLVIHALEREQVAGHVFDMLLAGDGLDKKRIARAASAAR